jgi:hypothetical protein
MFRGTVRALSVSGLMDAMTRNLPMRKVPINDPNRQELTVPPPKHPPIDEKGGVIDYGDSKLPMYRLTEQSVQAVSMTKQQSAADVINEQGISGFVNRSRNALFGHYDPEEHFLLVDLDIDRDQLIFGNSREEFYENVERTKKLILDFQTWDRRDKIYLVMTRFAQFCSFVCAYFALDFYLTAKLLHNQFADYETLLKEDVVALHKARESSRDIAIEEVNALPLFKTGFNSEKGRELTRELRRVLLPSSIDYLSIVREEMVDYANKKYARLAHPD